MCDEKNKTCNDKRCQAITEIIESVAKEQAALARILSEEGEKLHKVNNLSHVSPEELLKVNESVRATINSIARLELILQAKLELFDDCLCKCPHDHMRP